ncbi:hypothetical protein GCM10023148_54460 [Actinokineospora soli]
MSGSEMSGATGQPRVGVVFPASGRCDHVDLTANLAVLLACSGRRVLVLDFAGDDRSVQEYLAPFPRTSVRAPLELQSAVTALVAEPLVAVATMLRFDLADDQSGAVATIEVGEPAGLPRLAPARAGAQAVTELRTALLGSGFDDVLVALPEPEPDTAAAEALAAKLADTVLVAFGPSESAVTAAAVGDVFLEVGS